jgi:hypothetical protein
MPSSYSASARFTLQATGENNNTWGVILNTGVFQLVDSNINGRLGFTLSGTRVLTTALGAADEARLAFLDVTGGTGGTVTIPAVSKGYFVRNGATGGVTISAGGPTSALFAAGDAGPCFSDGSSTYGLRLAGLSLIDYISAAVIGASGSLPGALGNLGKTLVVVDVLGTETWVPTFMSTDLISDYDTNIVGLAVAMAVAL